MSVTHADHTWDRRIHGSGEGGLGKQVSAKNTGTGDHIRVTEEAIGPSRQDGRYWDTEPHKNGRQKHRTSLVCSKCLVDSLITGAAISTSEHRACV